MAQKNDNWFDPLGEKQNIIDWIKRYFADNGTPDTKAVIGISGGKDSTIAAALLCEALGSDRVIGVLMPEGSQKDIHDSYKVCECLGIKYYEINIATTMNALTEEIPQELFELNDNNDIYWTNTPARIRMATLYSVAGLVGGRVCNTGNRSEIFVGYTTKYGDMAGDFALFHSYTATEVVAIGLACTYLPKELVQKDPSDGMSGLTDEDKLGFSYADLDAYLLYGTMPDMTAYERINRANKISAHKRSCLRLPAPTKGRF